MKINRNNYEAFFVDYLDGKLDVSLVDDFIEFLQQNPDLKEELSLIETVSLKEEEITYNKKELLKKEKYDSEKEFNKAAIAELEGDISDAEKVDFESYLSSHPEKQKDVELFKLTKLKPELSVVFSKKSKIRKRSTIRTILLWSTSAAAVIIAILSVYIFIDTPSSEIITQNQVAEVIDKAPEKKENTPVEAVIPEKKEKKAVQPNITKEVEKPATKKTNTKTEPQKSLRENSKGRLEKDDLAVIRTNEEIPEKMIGLSPAIFAAIPKTELAPVVITLPNLDDNIAEEKYFVDMVKEKTGIEKISINKITKAGLNLVSNISQEKFDYDTNDNGKVTEVKYDSRFLAFSIPTKRKSDQE
jgi:hypothetical protein